MSDKLFNLLIAAGFEVASTTPHTVLTKRLRGVSGGITVIKPAEAPLLVRDARPFGEPVTRTGRKAEQWLKHYVEVNNGRES